MSEERTKREKFMFSRRGLDSIHRPYDNDELELMFGPYLRERDIVGLNPREVRLLSTLIDKIARIAELEVDIATWRQLAEKHGEELDEAQKHITELEAAVMQMSDDAYRVAQKALGQLNGSSTIAGGRR